MKRYKSINFDNTSCDSDCDSLNEYSSRSRRMLASKVFLLLHCIYKRKDIYSHFTKAPSEIIVDSNTANGNTSFWSTMNTRSKYYLPMLQWIPHYNRNVFYQDILSGLSISSLFITQALSYATALCKIPAIHGLYTITITTFIYACLGMSP
jgi:hypothetical protein